MVFSLVIILLYFTNPFSFLIVVISLFSFQSEGFLLVSGWDYKDLSGFLLRAIPLKVKDQ